jgi:hypothetical protein
MDRPIPEGSNFLKLVHRQEKQCETDTRKAIPKMGNKAPLCLEHLGTVNSLLDRAGSCFWRCSGVDHIMEYMAGRVSNSSRASIRLLYSGFYDEALTISRGIYEVANLLFLFMMDLEALSKWKVSTKKGRIHNFSPLKVRLQLEALKVPLPCNESRYSWLCEIAAHVTPQSKPQAHNPLGIPTAGAYFQQGGVLLSLNEVGAATALAAIPLPKLLNLEYNNRKYFREASLKLLESVGAVDVLGVEEMWREIRSRPNKSLSSTT